MSHVVDLTSRIAVAIGATSGLGQTIAVGLARNYGDVVASGRRHARLEEVCAGLRLQVSARSAALPMSLIETNLNGALRACQCFYDPLKTSGRGRIIKITSLEYLLGSQQVAGSCAANSALLSPTRLAWEWAREDISVNAIAPGVFPTEFDGRIINGTPGRRELLMRTPMGRFGRPEELVDAAILLASHGASLLTNQRIALDTGYLASGVNS